MPRTHGADRPSRLRAGILDVQQHCTFCVVPCDAGVVQCGLHEVQQCVHDVAIAMQNVDDHLRENLTKSGCKILGREFHYSVMENFITA
jgi:hypothetical protein